MIVINRFPRMETSQRGMLAKADILNGVHHLLGDAHARRGHTAYAAHHRLYNAAADGEDHGHDLHGGADRNLGCDETDEVAQGVLRPLQVPEAGRRLKDAHGKEQHQQAIAHGLQALIDPDNGVPDIAAPELLRSDRDQRPDLRQLVIPSAEGSLQGLYDPVVAQSITSYKGKGTPRGVCPFLI